MRKLSIILLLLLSSCYSTRTTFGDVVICGVKQFQNSHGPFYQVTVVPVGGHKSKWYNTTHKFLVGDTVNVSKLK
jgi:hypothetical protein